MWRDSKQPELLSSSISIPLSSISLDNSNEDHFNCPSCASGKPPVASAKYASRSNPILCPVSKQCKDCMMINAVNEAEERYYNQMSWMMYQRIMDSRLKRASNQTVLVGGNNENFREEESTMKIIETNASKVNDKFQDSVGAALDNFNSEDDDDQGIFDIDMD